MAVTFALVLAIPLQYAVLAGATISVLKYVYLASLDARVVELTISAEGRVRESGGPAAISDGSVSVLEIYGSLFFGASPKIKAALPAAGAARRAVVVLRLHGRETLHSATLALIRDYAAELAAGGGRLYLAGIGATTEDQLRRTGLLQTLGADAVVPASADLYGSCIAAQRRGRAWLGAHADDESRKAAEA